VVYCYLDRFGEWFLARVMKVKPKAANAAQIAAAE
jgi:hypothetical protein